MGAGASTANYDLSPEEKAAIAKALQEKYFDLSKKEGENPPNDVELFEALKHTFEESLGDKHKVKIPGTHHKVGHVHFDEVQNDIIGKDSEGRPLSARDRPISGSTPSATPVLLQSDSLPELNKAAAATAENSGDDEEEHYEFTFKNTYNINQDKEDHENNNVISKIEGPGKLLRAKTSAQLLSMVNDNVLDDTEKIASFISQLKTGEGLVTKGQTEFRQRRLTYSQHTVSEEEAAATVISKAQLAAKPPPKITRSRTTIFASSEIGVKQEKKAPFPPAVMGTYSCHGIEPSPDEIDGIHEKINQDRGCVVYPYNNSNTEALLMVLDGHGEQGDKVSEFVMRQVVVSLEKDPLLNTDPVKALRNAYLTTNTALLVTDINYMTSGTTCVTIYLKENHFYVANAGDSRAVMAYTGSDGSILAKDFTRDHKPDDPEEHARIEQWGGFVCPPHEEGLSARVYLDKEFTMIGLAMARSIGDHAVKNVGVIADPEVKEFDLQEEDQFLIMASDGVWEFISSEEAVQIVQSYLNEGVYEACQELIETAAARWQDMEGDYRDDITAIIIKFPLPNFPSVQIASATI